MAFIPVTDQDRAEMLARIGVQSVDELFSDLPSSVRFPDLGLPEPLSELEAQLRMRGLAEQNRDLGALVGFVGAGCYNHYVPATVLAMIGRSEFLTSYTPYQAELSQGTLQAMFEFQSLTCDLLGMEVANASVYDGSSGTAEAVLMAQRLTGRDRVVLAGDLHPEYRAVVQTYVRGRGVEVVTTELRFEQGRLTVGPVEAALDQRTACVVVQQPSFLGAIHDLSGLAERVHAAGALLVIAVAEANALGLLKSPGAWQADIAVAEGQSLGVPMQFGGPWVGMMATRNRFVRQLPGRIAGATTDAAGRRGFVLTLQAREQHIRREKATSNICTSQTLMALAVTVYLSLVGPSGLRSAAATSHQRARELAARISALQGYHLITPHPFFNEFAVQCPQPVGQLQAQLLERGFAAGYDLGRLLPELSDCLLLCCTELTSRDQIAAFSAALEQLGRPA